MGRTSRARTTTGALLVAGALLAGCGGDGAEPADDAGDGGGGEAVVEVEGLAFTTPSISVAAGTTVVWRNADGVPHTATAGSPDGATGEFDVSIPAEGEGSTAVDEPGTYAYYCTIHPSMTAELVVTDG